jgi:hypothetical protein
VPIGSYLPWAWQSLQPHSDIGSTDIGSTDIGSMASARWHRLDGIGSMWCG